MDKKKLRNDLILITSILLAIAVSLLIIAINKKTTNLIAKVSVNNKVVQVIDLSDKSERDYVISGTKGNVRVHTHNGYIGVAESNCPHQDCVNMGYVNTTNRPIICAYNAVAIYIEGNSSYDIEI